MLCLQTTTCNLARLSLSVYFSQFFANGSRLVGSPLSLPEHCKDLRKETLSLHKQTTASGRLRIPVGPKVFLKTLLPVHCLSEQLPLLFTPSYLSDNCRSTYWSLKSPIHDCLWWQSKVLKVLWLRGTVHRIMKAQFVRKCQELVANTFHPFAPAAFLSQQSLNVCKYQTNVPYYSDHLAERL